MAVAGGPNIVEDGLVLALDAANEKSYPGSGTVWSDLTANEYSGSLYNDPYYIGDNGGAVYFDGTNDYALIDVPGLSSETTITVEMWANWRSGTNGMFFGFNIYDIYSFSGHLGFNNANANVIGISATEVDTLGLLGNYHHYVFIMNKTGLLTENKLYIDGDSKTLAAHHGLDGNCRSFSNSIKLNGWLTSTGYNLPLNYGTFKVYNRELSTSEVLQNYNATKGRFGL